MPRCAQIMPQIRSSTKNCYLVTSYIALGSSFTSSSILNLFHVLLTFIFPILLQSQQLIVFTYFTFHFSLNFILFYPVLYFPVSPTFPLFKNMSRRMSCFFLSFIRTLFESLGFPCQMFHESWRSRVFVTGVKL